MDAAHKERLVEEAKQRTFVDTIDKAHQKSNFAEATALHEEIMKTLGTGQVEAATVKGLVDHIFNKATSDVEACPTLAELCTLIPSHFDPPEPTAAPKEKGAGSRGSSEKRVDFRLMVLKKCKEELEKGGAAMKAVRQWDAKEHAGGKKAGLKGEDKEQAELDRAALARMLAAVQFCGALYNVGILTEKIIHSAIDALIKDEADYSRHENMEILANLLKSIGGKLDSPSRSSKDSKTVAEYFKRVQKIKEEAASKDIAKMMDKVLTLRENNWVQAS